MKTFLMSRVAYQMLCGFVGLERDSDCSIVSTYVQLLLRGVFLFSLLRQLLYLLVVLRKDDS